jgi:peptidyl-prolyl cis-trans isomerase SurA
MRIQLIAASFLLSLLYSYSSQAQIDSLQKGSSPIQTHIPKDPGLLKAEKIRKRLLKGESFCDLVREFSEDYNSVVVCGELGYFKSGILVPEYETAALKLKPGEISSIIKSNYGYHIIQLIAIKHDQDDHVSFDTRHILIKIPQ